MPKSLEFWALIISILAIGISLITWFKSHKIDRARRDDEEKDQNSAIIRAYLTKKPDNLIIENIGHSGARNISIHINKKPIQDAPGIHVPLNKKDIIGPHSHISFQLSMGFDVPAPEFIEITWDDDDSTGKTYRNSLSY
jgi:hypothetical protein